MTLNTSFKLQALLFLIIAIRKAHSLDFRGFLSLVYVPPREGIDFGEGARALPEQRLVIEQIKLLAIKLAFERRQRDLANAFLMTRIKRLQEQRRRRGALARQDRKDGLKSLFVNWRSSISE